MRTFEWTPGVTPPVRNARWALVYATVDQDIRAAISSLSQRMPDTQIFGCTSSTGIFCPRGFVRGVQVLLAEENDGILAEATTRACSAISARRLARDAAAELVQRLGEPPATMLLHATPGFEERILEGIEEAFHGHVPPVYGGSAADDDLSGKWKVFGGGKIETEGFVLAAFSSPRKVWGSLVAGYLPTSSKGTVTRATGRVVHEIDGRPAADVYDKWRYGALASKLGTTSTILADTTMHPLGKQIDKLRGIPRYLLGHPHQFLADRSLSLFAEVAVGEELVLMMGTPASLLERTEQAVTRAMGSDRSATLQGAILIFCGGCVMALGDAAREVPVTFQKQVRGAPFIGAATFGEIGCFPGPTPMNRHGNLMCDAVLFG